MKPQILLFAEFFITLLLVEIPAKSGYTQPCLPDGITFTSQAQIDNFATNYPGCFQILGNVTISEDSSNNITNLNALSPLTNIRGYLNVFNNASLTDLSGLDNLTSIGEYGEYLYVVDNPSLTDLSGLDDLTFIGGGLLVADNASLTDLSILQNLTSFLGEVWVSGNASLTDLSGLDNLTYIGTNLRILDNVSLTDLSGLDNLTYIEGHLDVGFNDSLTSLSGLDNLTYIGGDLEVHSNDALTSLSGLDNLTYIEGYLNVNGNASLTDLSSLDNIDASTIDNLNLAQNPNLSICEVKSICDYLEIPANPATIIGNATGCNTRPEVESACQAVPVSETFAMYQAIEIFPNPSSGSFKITGVEEGEMKIVDGLSRLVTKEAISNQGMDISELANGVYFILIHSDNQLITKRIIKNR